MVLLLVVVEKLVTGRARVFKRLGCSGRLNRYPRFILQDFALESLSIFLVFLKLHPHSIQDGGS